MDKIAVLIPCYNEEITIRKVIEDFKAVLPEAVIYVYNNNSTDNTRQIAQQAGAVVRDEYIQGKGNVIRRMFREIDAECYIITDGDDTYPAKNARAMADLVLTKKADMVIGDRLSSNYYKENKRLFHSFGNNLVCSSINMLFHSDIKDIMTGYRAFSFLFVKTFPVLSRGFEIETEMSIHAVDKNMFVQNEIIEYKNRPEGSVSKLNTYRDGIKVLLTIYKLFRIYKPTVFFSALALILLVISIILFLPIFAEYLKTGLVPRIPTLVTSGFVMMAAIQAFFSGMLSENIQKKDRQDFEFRLNLLYGELERKKRESACRENAK